MTLQALREKVGDAALRLMDLLPNVRTHVFGQCGHWAQLEHTQAFHELVLDFFAGVGD